MRIKAFDLKRHFLIILFSGVILIIFFFAFLNEKVETVQLILFKTKTNHTGIYTYFVARQSFQNISQPREQTDFVPLSLIEKTPFINKMLEELRFESLTNLTNQHANITKQLIVLMNNNNKKELKDKWKFKTILYPWNDDDRENSANFNLLFSEYYPIVVDRKYCQELREVPVHFENFYNFSCVNDVNKLTKPHPFLKPSVRSQMNTEDSEGEKYFVPTPSKMITRDKIQLIFVCSPCLVTFVGKVKVDGYKPQRWDCDNVHENFESDPNKVVFYDEVFVACQQWGFSYFHMMVEDFPKIALYLEFLKKNPQIKISFRDRNPRIAELLEVLGLNSTRLVSGTMAAKIAYVPRNTHCFSANIIDVQMLNRAYNERTIKVFNEGKPLVRNKIILIKRSGIRRILEHSEIVKELETIAKEHNLVFEVFNDSPTPSLNHTMMTFAQAVAVIGPHGAGFSNLLFSAPGTIVIEGLMKRKLIICFQRLSYALGMRYYGMTSQIDGINEISLDPKLVAYHLNLILHNIGL